LSRKKRKHRPRTRGGSRLEGPPEARATTGVSAGVPYPLFNLHLFGLQSRRLDLLVTVALISVVILSRIAAFQGSIWDQDEAYFATSVISFDPVENHPHPPWFPLFIGLAKVVHAMGADPARSLQIVSAVLGCWMLFPLVSLWSGIIGRKLGVAAAVLFLFLPGPWLLAGRAYSGTAATAFLVAGLAFWLGRRDDRWSPALGGILMGLAVLTRPQFLPVVLVTLVVLGGWKTAPRPRAAWAAFGTIMAVGAAALMLASSGLEPLLEAMEQHSRYHFGALPESSRIFAESGLVRCLLSPVAGWSWSILVLVGAWSTFRSRTSQRAAAVVISALVALLAVVIGASDPSHARYFVPLLALSTGFVVAALAVVRRSLAYGGVIAAVALSAAVVVPQLSSYRVATSPAIAALDEAVTSAGSEGSVLVADHTLISFVGLLKASREAFPAVIYDNQIEAGRIPPPPPSYSIAVFASGHGGLVEMESGRRIHTCSVPIVRTLERDRFLDIVVSTKPVLRGWVDDGKPYIIIDGD